MGDTKKRPTHAEIAARAEKLFLDSGCVPGRDEQNWLLAEAQLKQEIGFRLGAVKEPTRPKRKRQGEQTIPPRNAYAAAR